jgi:hypothetical protein
MKKLFGGVRYKLEDGGAIIYAPLKTTGKLAEFGRCHPASIVPLRLDWKKNSHLVNVTHVS